MAKRSRCCSPPRAPPDPAAGDRGDARPLQHLPDGAADGEQPGGVLGHLSHREVLEQPRLLMTAETRPLRTACRGAMP